jgi:hypothetical protein
MEYRTVGDRHYAHDEQIALRNQVWANRPARAPAHPAAHRRRRPCGAGRSRLGALEDLAPERWGTYDETGVVTVTGACGVAAAPDFGPAAEPFPAPGERRSAWSLVNLDAIAVQTRAGCCPSGSSSRPRPSAPARFRSEPTLDLSEGRTGHAIQWFTFATILGLGYPLVYLRQQGPNGTTAEHRWTRLNTDGFTE